MAFDWHREQSPGSPDDEVWQTISLFNPVVYLISGFRWSFYENADGSVWLSIATTVGFLLVCLFVVRWIFKSGYKLRS